MKTTLVIFISAVLFCSACQQRQRAELHALYMANRALETQINALSGQQQGFLDDCNMIIRTSLNRKAKRAELKLWQHLIIETDLQLRSIEKIKAQCFKRVGANNAYFATLFVAQGQKQIDVTPWANKIQQIKAYADSLYQANAQIVKVSPNQGILSEVTSKKLPWTLFYSELNQWKLALLKATEKVIAHHTQDLDIATYKCNSLGVFLEILPESQTVLEGQEYVATMQLLDLEVNKLNPRMKVNGEDIPVYEGQGIVRFRPTKPGPHEWTGAMTFKNRGRDTTFTVKKKYWVLSH
ncbi:MAG TPA: hypothetical protein DCS93_11380 [Microscillaceae bacterium]|nr:hypothetical protein [Microscillaceae bacterium]